VSVLSKEIVCPYCGFKAPPEEFTYMYESVLYLADDRLLQEERERPVLVICPKCGGGFFLKSPYQKVFEKIMRE